MCPRAPEKRARRELCSDPRARAVCQTLFAEGCRGSCSEAVMKHFNLRDESQPQTYALGTPGSVGSARGEAHTRTRAAYAWLAPSVVASRQDIWRRLHLPHGPEQDSARARDRSGLRESLHQPVRSGPVAPRARYHPGDTDAVSPATASSSAGRSTRAFGSSSKAASASRTVRAA